MFPQCARRWRGWPVASLPRPCAAAAGLAWSGPAVRGDYDTAYIYAGQGAARPTRQRPAAEVLTELATARDLLQRAAQHA
jgi:hypothetical protein